MIIKNLRKTALIKSVGSIFLNGSEHTYNFSLPETLMLRDYSSNNGYSFCYQIGGCESVRDIQQSRIVGSDALECFFIESRFAYSKLLNSIHKVYGATMAIDSEADLHGQASASRLTVFAVINTLQSLDTVDDILRCHKDQSPSFELVPVIDRRSLIKEMNNIDNNRFFIDAYEKSLNQKLCSYKWSSDGTNFGIMGGITGKSVMNSLDQGICSSYVRTGLFTLKFMSNIIQDFASAELEISSAILKMNQSEAYLLETLGYNLTSRYNKASHRQHHIIQYLFNSDLPK